MSRSEYLGVCIKGIVEQYLAICLTESYHGHAQGRGWHMDWRSMGLKYLVDVLIKIFWGLQKTQEILYE